MRADDSTDQVPAVTVDGPENFSEQVDGQTHKEPPEENVDGAERFLNLPSEPGHGRVPDYVHREEYEKCDRQITNFGPGQHC